jgi:hypothetical protein
MIGVFQSVSGSPGTSVWSVLTAALWSTDESPPERVVVEADLAGGVMSARYQLASTTDLLMAEAGRWEPSSRIDMSQFAARVADGAWLVPGAKTPESAQQLWRTFNGVSSIATMAASDPRVWLFDVGRSTPDGMLEPLFSEAAVSVLFVRGAAEELARARRRVVSLKSTGAHVMVAVTGACDHRRSEVLEFLGTSHVQFLPDDGRLVEDSRHVWAGRKGRRREIWTAGAGFAAAIAEVFEFSPRGVMRVAEVS